MKRLTLTALLATSCAHVPTPQQTYPQDLSALEISKQVCAETMMAGGEFSIQQGALLMGSAVSKEADSFDAMYVLGDASSKQAIYLIDEDCDGKLDAAQRCDISDSPRVCGSYKDLGKEQELFSEVRKQVHAALTDRPYSISQITPNLEQSLSHPVSINENKLRKEPTARNYGAYQLIRLFGDFDEDGSEEMQYGVRRSSKIILLRDLQPYGTLDEILVCDNPSSDELRCAPVIADGDRLYRYVHDIFAGDITEFSEEFNSIFFSIMNSEIIPDRNPLPPDLDLRSL